MNAMKTYVDFELEIERVGRKRYRARVSQAPRGKGARSTFDLPAEEELEGFRRDLLNDRSSRHLEIDHPRRGNVETLGRRLFEKVFSQRVREAWRASRDQVEDRLRLRLRLDEDPRLLAVPWELLLDPDRGRFVATERPVVRTLESSTSPRRLAAPKPFRMLAVLSCPPDVQPLEIEREWSVLDQVLGETMELTKSVPPTLDEIDRALRGSEWHILHFVGHGHADEAGGFLFLENQEGTSRAVDHVRLGIFLGHESLRLIVLNACEGARPGRNDPFSGVAQALLAGGVPAVVAMQQAVSDAAAIAFAKYFYGALAQGRAVDEALLEARRSLYRQSEVEWVIPVLYLNAPDGSLTESQPTAVPLPPPPRTSRRLIATGAVIAGVLLLLFGLWLWPWREPQVPPSDPSQGTLQPPKGSVGNPKECPSPLGLDMAFARIEPDIFQMGQSGGEDEDEPVHQVTITSPFCIGVYEVTQEQWNRVMGDRPPKPEDRYLPARGITYQASQNFLRLLDPDPARPAYRLPTEAEWEYVARANTTMIFSFGDDPSGIVNHGNCGESGDGFDGPTWVGQFPANRLGVHDMSGNVFEWVADFYGKYPAEAVEDPHGPQKGSRGIRRGGSWKSGAEACSPAARSAVLRSWRREENGFRIVREIW